MRIKEFSVRSYGRLNDTGKILLNRNFVLSNAGNGEGKTLLIDSLIKMMFKKGARGAFRDEIKRVNEEPSGYLRMEDEAGNQIKMPEEGHIPDFWNLSPSDFRNVFVIRDSDLFITEESSYYTDASERLTGIKTGEISAIKEALADLFFLTRSDSSAILRSTKGEDNYLGRRVRDEAPALLNKIGDLKEKIEEKDFEDYEIRVNRIQEKIEEIRKELEDLENARKRKNYEKGSEALNSLKEALGKLRKLDVYSRDGLDKFRDAEKELERSKSERQRLKREVEELEGKIGQSENELEKLNRKHGKLEKIKGNLDEEIEPKIEKLEGEREDLASKKETSDLVTRAGAVSTALLAISIIGVTLAPTLLVSVFALVFFVSTLGLGGFKFYLKWKAGQLARKLEEIKLATARLGLDGETLEEILSNIGEFRGCFDNSKKDLENARVEVRTLGRQKEDKKGNLKNAETKSDENQKKMGQIKKESKVESPDEYEKKLTKKQNWEKERDKHKETLDVLFGSEVAKQQEENPEVFLDDTVKNIRQKLSSVHTTKYLEALEKVESKTTNRNTVLKAISRKKEKLTHVEEIEKTPKLDKLKDYWREKIEELNEYQDRALDVEFDESKLAKLREDRGNEEGKKKKLEKEMQPILEKLSDVETRANEILNLRGTDKLPCETLADLEAVEKEIKSFVIANKEVRDNALTVMGIFGEIEGKEKQKIADALKGVSAYFSQITREKFEKVELEPEEVRLQVKEKGRKGFRNVSKLSGGEMDQLYFSVRLALGEELLKGNKGFFILDDPFIKADPRALQTQLNMVKEISKTGWQILYFTAKGEVADELSKDVKSGLIQEVPVPSIT